MNVDMPPPIRMAWVIGNTTVRNALRIRGGLIALSQSPLLGNLDTREREQDFARLLDATGVTVTPRLHQIDKNGVEFELNASDSGRKWRAAMMQLGFITPSQEVLTSIGSARKPFTVTPAGKRLIAATEVVQQQECFLRAMLAHQLPSPIEDFPPGPTFSPLRIVFDLLQALEHGGMEPYIDRNEMAAVVQLVRRAEEIPDALARIADYRVTLGAVQGRRDRNAYRRTFRENARTDSQAGGSLWDYSDTNFRYIKATGLFVDRGSRIEVADYQRTTVAQILARPYQPIADAAYPERLWQGASLPTDESVQAAEAVRALAATLGAAGMHVPLPDLLTLDVPDLSQLRLALQQQYLEILEAEYALQQVTETEDILAHLREFTQPASQRKLVPRDNAPGYFEWSVWRAFLAIDSLVNSAAKARGF